MQSPPMDELFQTAKDPNLVFDVGMHNGTDTAFYLSKGFRVVAVEANPKLAAECRERFQAEIAESRLTIVEGAIVPPSVIESGQTSIKFYRSDSMSVWGTICDDWVDRNHQLGTNFEAVEVPVIDFVQVLREQGIPRYMKVDVEGVDMVCIDALERFQVRPDYVSVEADFTTFQAAAEQVDRLASLGYNAFKDVEQSSIPATHVLPNPPLEGRYVDHRFRLGSSGAFGRELPGDWYTQEQVLRRFYTDHWRFKYLSNTGMVGCWQFPGVQLMRKVTRRAFQQFSRQPVPGWYDTHARHSTAQ
ncbi:FkbM family methyltransferase [Aeoliella sp. SH292]|uniref:FkbM family methyltransferase n=1 Tax=Aeoliella sp. SH292 TaxID=3454464 RepID=UPI003F964A82